MTKKIRKILIVTFFSLVVLSVVTIYSIIKLQYHWKNDPEAICGIAGGFWDGVQGCDNFCDKTDKNCSDNIVFGCWCGLDKCWTGTECILRINRNN